MPAGEAVSGRSLECTRHRFGEELDALDEPQARERLELQRRHEAQSLDMDRRLRALSRVEARELQSLETAMVKRTAHQNAGAGRRQPHAGVDA